MTIYTILGCVCSDEENHDLTVSFASQEILDLYEDTGFDCLLPELDAVLARKYGADIYVDDTVEISQILPSRPPIVDLVVNEYALSIPVHGGVAIVR